MKKREEEKKKKKEDRELTDCRATI
jgi:hypothetical protein